MSQGGSDSYMMDVYVCEDNKNQLDLFTRYQTRTLVIRQHERCITVDYDEIIFLKPHLVFTKSSFMPKQG